MITIINFAFVSINILHITRLFRYSIFMFYQYSYRTLNSYPPCAAPLLWSFRYDTTTVYILSRHKKLASPYDSQYCKIVSVIESPPPYTALFPVTRELSFKVAGNRRFVPNCRLSAGNSYTTAISCLTICNSSVIHHY